jgi:uncharacterized membrane protein (DUF4010 family)
MLMTLVLGALAASGAIALALAAAVIVAVLLDLKPTLHGWLRLIEHRELTAALQLLVLSVVILPNLPNAGFGPYGALNPYALWWAVVLIAGLSLAGHLAMRLTGSERGILWTGILGGLASSTAATVTLARRARAPALAGISVAGILAACGVMFFRMAVLIGMIQPALLNTYGLALSLTGLVLLLLSVWTWRRHARSAPLDGPIAPIKPFDLGTALGFGVFLAVMAVLVPAAKQWFGASGIYLLSAVSGLADVDAIVISLARMHASDGMSGNRSGGIGPRHLEQHGGQGFHCLDHRRYGSRLAGVQRLCACHACRDLRCHRVDCRVMACRGAAGFAAAAPVNHAHGRQTSWHHGCERRGCGRAHCQSLNWRQDYGHGHPGQASHRAARHWPPSPGTAADSCAAAY